MTTDILAQSLHNCITRSGYQIQVWWHGNSAAFTSYKRANDELARLQRFEVPQQQALSLLDTLYNQYDAMAEQYEAMTQYIKTTFNTQKLNKVIDQLTADLMAVTECHPQMVQQAQAQAVGATVADSGLTLNDITTEDEWPTVSIRFDDDDFAPDSLGDLWQPQMVQQAQAQALGATALTDSRVEYAVDVAGDSEITVADSGLTTSEVPPALSPEDIRFDHHYTTKKTVNVWTFDEKLGRIELGQLRFLNHGDDSQFMVNGEVIISFDNADNHQTLTTKIAAYLNGEMRPQPVQQAQAQALGATALTDSRVEYVVDVAGDSSETVADSGLTLGDFVETGHALSLQPYPKRISPDAVVSSVESGVYTLQCPADSHLAHTLESRRIAQNAIATLEAWGFVVAQDLKRDFGFFVTPKILRKKITQTIEKLNSAKLHSAPLELPDDAAFATDPAMQVAYLERVIADLEGLL